MTNAIAVQPQDPMRLRTDFLRQERSRAHLGQRLLLHCRANGRTFAIGPPNVGLKTPWIFDGR